MKKSIVLLFLMSMAGFGAGSTEVKKHEKTAKLEKDSYCNIPKAHGEFKKINEKDSSVYIDFDNCVFDGEKYENVKVAVLIQDSEKVEKYLKKYKYMHLKAGKNLVRNSDGSYYYNGSWAFNNDKVYPTVFDGEKTPAKPAEPAKNN